MTRQVLSFGIIGSIGFIIDGGLLLLYHEFFGLSLLTSRIFSFSIAICATWYLNRKLTFSHHGSRSVVHEGIYYAVFNSIGAILNFAIFMWLIYQYNYFSNEPIIPLAISSGIAMVFNFIMSKFFVFRGLKVG